MVKLVQVWQWFRFDRKNDNMNGYMAVQHFFFLPRYTLNIAVKIDTIRFRMRLSGVDFQVLRKSDVRDSPGGLRNTM
jgi:hypothetical protein